MPTYVYKCIPNDHVFEKKQKFSDPPLTECIVCGEDVRKVVSNVGIVFKGSGFYINDSKSKSSTTTPAKSSKKDSGGSAESSTSSETKSESKSETKAESKPAKTGDG